MKKMITLVVVVMLGLIATLATTPAFAQANPTTIHIHLTRSDVRPNPCNGEPVQLNAELDLVIHRNTGSGGGKHQTSGEGAHSISSDLGNGGTLEQGKFIPKPKACVLRAHLRKAQRCGGSTGGGVAIGE